MSINLFMEYIRPEIAYRNKESTYAEKVANCRIAEDSEIKLLNEVLSLSNRGQNDLLRSINMEKLACLEQNMIRTEMLSSGVSTERIEYLEISISLNIFRER